MGIRAKVLAPVVALALVMSPLAAWSQPVSGQVQCDAEGSQLDLGCTGCSTFIMFSCDTITGEDPCLGCHYSLFASLTCVPTVKTWTGSSDVACSGKYERRFGGCGGPGGGSAWGGVVCDCQACPPCWRRVG